MKGVAIQYSDEEIQWVSDNRSLPRVELHEGFCKRFCRDDVSMTNLTALRKRKGWKTGRTGQFKPGNIPHPNAFPKGPNKTSFKKGNQPHNNRKIGSERLNKDGYIEVKVSDPNRWALKHILLWIEHYGPVPDGYCVSFNDLDKSNISIENLELLSRGENLQANKLINKLGTDYISTIRPLAKVISKTNSLKGG